MIRFIADTAGGVYQLARLAVITRFRFRGEYWTWRMHTAFGNQHGRSRGEIVRSVVEYGRWIHRVRRGG